MSAQIPIPRGGIAVPRELSGLTSPREPGSLPHLWQPVAQQSGLAGDSQNNSGQLQRYANRTRQKINRIPSNLFPFKIYKLPYQYNGQPPDSTAWRTFRVRTGLVFPSGGGGIVPTGTDMVPIPDVETYYNNSTQALANQIVAPDNTSQFWIWINVTSSSSATIQASATPASAPVPWTTFPVPSSTNIPIGWIDTATYHALGVAQIRQILREDSLGIGGGTASSVTTYYYKRSYLNYWLCTTAFPGTNLVRVAKPHEIRNSVTTEMVYGQTFNYTYPHNTLSSDPLYGIYRLSTRASDSFPEWQGIIPQPQTGYEIEGTTATTNVVIEAQDVADNGGVTVGQPVTLMDVTASGRYWLAFNDQTYGH